MVTQLNEIVVYGSSEGWTFGDCFFADPGTQAYGYALGYIASDVFPDVNSAFQNSTPAAILSMTGMLCSIYDDAGHNQMTPGGLMSAYQNQWTTKPYAPTPYPLADNIWSVFKVTGHFLWGNGAKMSYPISQVGIYLNAGSIGPTNNTLAAFAAAHTTPGVYPYSSGNYGYSTYDSSDKAAAALILGGIVLNTNGNFTRNGDGSWSFDGLTSALDDTFNMDKRPGRPFWADVVVDTFNAIGGNDFDIEITGTLPTVLTGH